MKALVFLTLGVFVICISGCGSVKNEENVAASSTTITFNTQEVQPPQLLEYYPKKLAFLPEEPILLYFDKKPTDVTANFGDVSIEGNNVMITNADRFKNPYTVTWKGGSVDLVFEYTGLLDSVDEED